VIVPATGAGPLQVWAAVDRFRWLDDGPGGWLPGAGCAATPGGLVGAVGLFEASPGGLEGPVEALLGLGGGGVLAGSLLPALPDDSHLLVETLEDGLETADVLVQVSSFAGDEGCEAVLGGRSDGGGGGQITAGLAAFPPSAGTSGVIELAESPVGEDNLAGGVTDRAGPVGAGGPGQAGRVGQLREVLAGLGERSTGGVGLLGGAGARPGRVAAARSRAWAWRRATIPARSRSPTASGSLFSCWGSGRAVSIAQVEVRRAAQSRARSSRAWSRSSATT